MAPVIRRVNCKYPRNRKFFSNKLFVSVIMHQVMAAITARWNVGAKTQQNALTDCGLYRVTRLMWLMWSVAPSMLSSCIFVRVFGYEKRLDGTTIDKSVCVTWCNTHFFDAVVSPSINEMFRPAIYHNFQTELWRLRLTAARTTVDTIDSAESTISGDIGNAPIKLAAEVRKYDFLFVALITAKHYSAGLSGTGSGTSFSHRSYAREYGGKTRCLTHQHSLACRRSALSTRASICNGLYHFR